MKLKKLNAALALLSIVGILVHVSYQIFAYFTLYHNLKLTVITAAPFMVCACLHAVLGMAIVFTQADGTRIDVYKKRNMQTVLQRLSAALILPLLILHINAFGILLKFSQRGIWPMFWLVIFLQIVFFGAVVTHVALSVTKAFITLGILTDIKKVKILDRVFFVLGAVIFIASAFSVVRGEVIIFLPK